MAIEVFNRYEKKYRLDEHTYTRLTARLSESLQLDSYNEKTGGAYMIMNIYYDTEHNDFIRTSLAKPVYKEKLRLRSYGTPNTDSRVYVEIKKKVRGVVNKRRSGMRLSEAYNFLESGELPEPKSNMNIQVLREINYMLKTNALKPALVLSYERMAYFGDEDSGLRISFDSNIRSRLSDLRLESGAYGEHILPEGEVIMEIKANQSMPLWLCDLLSEYKIYSKGFSKYGTAYQNMIQRELCHAEQNYTAMRNQYA